MVQWTIEDGWNRLWLNEGIRLLARELRVVIRTPGTPEPETPTSILLPRHTLSVRTTPRAGQLFVECEEPHGLGDSMALARNVLQRGEVRLLGGEGGDRVVHCDEVQCPTPTTLVLPGVQGANAGILYVPHPCSPNELCEWLTDAARREHTPFHFSYDSSRDEVVTRVCDVPKGTRVRVLPGNLASCCGLSTAHSVVLHESPHRIPSESSKFWDYYEIPEGFYAPCHRPMCTGSPMRFEAQLEAVTNRYYFSLPAPKEPKPHLLLFQDPNGNTLSVEIPCGRYLANTLAALLETKMNTACEASDVFFAVSHEDDRWTFRCERKCDNRCAPASFVLLFHHPYSIDASRFGFPAQPLTGQASYIADQPTHEPVALDGRIFSNVIRCTEIPAQKRLRLHATGCPAMTCVVQEGQTGRLICVKTYVNKHPFAHGYQQGDVVRISPHEGFKLSETVSYSGTNAKIPMECSCLVHDGGNSDPTILTLRVPFVGGLADANTCFVVWSTSSPWNLNFTSPKTIPPHVMGFDAKAVQWGIDGSVRDDAGRRLSPFDAPNTHCFDHPDYVLMLLSLSDSATLEHCAAGQSGSVFCKVTLYPLFREERMLPRDATLHRRHVGRFTISFVNPDWSPYRFHGAHFSFSLNFFIPVPESL